MESYTLNHPQRRYFDNIKVWVTHHILQYCSLYSEGYTWHSSGSHSRQTDLLILTALASTTAVCFVSVSLCVLNIMNTASTFMVCTKKKKMVMKHFFFLHLEQIILDLDCKQMCQTHKKLSNTFDICTTCCCDAENFACRFL